MWSSDVTLPAQTVLAGEVAEFDPSRSVTVTMTGNLIVQGTLRMRPASADVVHRLIFTGINESKFVGGGMVPLATDVGLWVTGAGKLDLAGAPKQPWSEITTPEAGALVVGLVASPTGWQVGDEVAICPTRPPTQTGFASEFEVRKIVGINGLNVTLDAPLTWPHPSVEVAPGVLMRPEILNLTRNVRIEGTAAGRSHVFINSTERQRIDYVQVRHVGPRKISGRSTAFVLGRYGIHLHHCMDSQAGATFSGNVIRDAGSHCFVTHGTNDVTWFQAIAYNAAETPYWWDLPASRTERNASDDITYEGCVAANVQAPKGSAGVNTISGYLLNEGEGNRALGCVSVGVRGGATSSGAIWPSQVGKASGIWEFLRHVSHNCSHHGSYIWQNIPTKTHEPNESYIAYHNGDSGWNYGAYNDSFRLSDSILYANGVAGVRLHAGGTPPLSTFYERVVFDGGGVSPYGVIVVKHSLGPKHSLFLDCTFRGHKSHAVSLEETPLNGTLIDFVNTRVDPDVTDRELEFSDFRIVTMHPATVIRVQRRDGTAYQLKGPNAVMTTIGRFFP